MTLMLRRALWQRHLDGNRLRREAHLIGANLKGQLAGQPRLRYAPQGDPLFEIHLLFILIGLDADGLILHMLHPADFPGFASRKDQRVGSPPDHGGLSNGIFRLDLAIDMPAAVDCCNTMYEPGVVSRLFGGE